MSTSGKLILKGIERLHSCKKCRIRAYAEREPNSIVGRVWRWHSSWCPMWKAHQENRAEEQPGQLQQIGSIDPGV